jgi:translation initiation factor IF-1
VAGANAIRVEGVVVEVLPNQTWRVKLANGHQLRAFVRGKDRRESAKVAAGNRVWLELSPCDLSVGRMVLETQTA